MPKIVKIGLIAIGVLAAALGAVVMFVDVNQYRPEIQNQLEKALGRKVTLGTMSLGLLPPAIRIEQVAIDEDPAFPSDKPFLAAKEISVRVGLIPLLSKQVSVDTLRIIDPAVELIRSAEGKWNYSSLGKNS